MPRVAIALMFVVSACATEGEPEFPDCEDLGCTGLACGVATPDGVVDPEVCGCALPDGGHATCIAE